MESYIGEISLFAGSFAPKGWLFCHGQQLNTAAYPSLFAVLGTSYGGDGRSFFALPDLRSSVPVGAGSAPKLPTTNLGARGALNESAGGSPQVGTLGLNYIICVEGLFPPRN